MTKVSFYVLQDPEADRLLFACRLVEKIYSRGQPVFVATPDPDSVDDRLWTFAQGSFVPHERYTGNNADEAPVLVGAGDPPQTPRQVLLNLNPGVPDFFSSFDRCVEIVGGDPATRSAARERYRYYRDRGYALESHDIT